MIVALIKIFFKCVIIWSMNCHLRYESWHNEKTGPRTLRTPSIQDPMRTQDTMRTQDVMRTQDPTRTQNSMGTKTLWGPRTLRGLRTLWVPTILWGPRVLREFIILWWPTKDPEAYKLVSWFPHHVFHLVEFTTTGRENGGKYFLF